MADWKNHVPVSMQHPPRVRPENHTYIQTLPVTKALAGISGALVVYAAIISASVIVPLVLFIVFLNFLMSALLYNRKQLAKAKKTPELEVNDDSLIKFVHSKEVDPNTITLSSIYECPLFDASVLEKRMVEAGILTLDDITLCENLTCPNCADERERRRVSEMAAREERMREHDREVVAARLRNKERKEKAIKEADAAKIEAMSKAMQTRVRSKAGTGEYTEVYVASTMESIRTIGTSAPSKCGSCGDFTFYSGLCPACHMTAFKKDDVAKAKRTKLAKAAEEQRIKDDFEAKRIVSVRGVTVRRPSDVPEGADPEVVLATSPFDNDYVFWRWFADGKQMGAKQLVLSLDFKAVAQNGSKVGTWQAIFDPDTNEHLGDFRVVDGRNETREPLAAMVNKINFNTNFARLHDWESI